MPWNNHARKRRWPEITDAQYIERMKSKCVVNDSTGCWEFQGFKNNDGYGDMSYRGSNWKVHALSYFLATGINPRGKVVCHKCDVRSCCNPDHLWLGTRADNNKDMYAKGRGKYQENRYTHCKSGHEYTTETVRYTKDGFRQCKVCELIRNRLRAGWPLEKAEAVPKVPHGFRVVRAQERVIHERPPKQLTPAQLRQQRYRVRRKERLAKIALVE